MSTPEPPGIPAPSVPPAATTPPVAAPSAPSPSAGRVWRASLLAGLLAGLASWGIGEAVHPIIPLQNAPASMGVTPEMSAAVEFNRAAYPKNSAAYYGEVAALLGLALGLAGGIARRSPRPGILAGVFGLVLGGLVAAAATWGVIALSVRYPMTDPNDLVYESLFLGGIWGPIGLTGGLALGLGLGRKDRVVGAALNGLVGALLGTGLYPIVVSSIATTIPNGSVVSGSATTRLIATLVLSLCVAVAAARGATTGPSRKVAAAPTPAA